MGGFFRPEVDVLLNSINVPVDRPESWPLLLSISERVVRTRTNAPHVYRNIMLLALTNNVEDALMMLKLAVSAYPKRRSDFENMIRRAVQDYPDHSGVRAISEFLQSTSRGSPRRAQ